MKIVRRISGNQYSLIDALTEIENILFSTVKDNYPSEWDNRLLDRSLCTGLQSTLSEKKILVPGSILYPRITLYERREESEHFMGDIAVIVHNTFHDGDITQGVSFLASSVRESGKNSFSFRKDYLKRIQANGSFAGLVLYDYDNISGMAFPTVPESVIGTYPHNWQNWTAFSNAVFVQSEIALELGHKSTALYKASLPLSYQLCFRYFYGLDLSHNSTAIESVKGFRSDKGNPTYVMAISLSHGKKLNEEIGINTDIYRKME